MLNIFNIETSNYVNGDGNRYVLWVQGCNLKCIGCWNTQTWSFENKDLKSVSEIFTEIKGLEETLSGVTFSGGEPFLQANELYLLAKRIKEETSLSLQIFTGFEKDELVNKDQLKLLDQADTLISGRFDNSVVNNNQKLYILNNDITPWSFNNSDIEIEIADDLSIKVTGYPTNELIDNLKDI